MRVFDKLLRDCRRALNGFARFQICRKRAQYASDVIAFVGIKPPVFEGDESVFDVRGQRVGVNVAVGDVRYLFAVSVQHRRHGSRSRKQRRVELRLFRPFGETDVSAERGKSRDKHKRRTRYGNYSQNLFAAGRLFVFAEFFAPFVFLLRRALRAAFLAWFFH